MSTANNSGITLEFEPGAEPIRGLIEHSDGSRKPFWGWLELIEELRRAAAHKVDGPDSPGHAGPAPPPEP